MAEFNPIRAFVGRDDQGHETGGLDFVAAFTWNSTQILDFLRRVSENPATYGVPNPDARRPALVLLYGHINQLQPNGTGFAQPEPPQQLLRRVLQQVAEIVPTDPIPWAGNNFQERTFAIFDMLGIILSLLGPVPLNGTAKNFLLPLVVVYAKWSHVLSGPDLEPTMIQVTWGSRAGENQPRYYFLGASLGGFAHQEPWDNLAKERRWNYVNDVPLQNRADYPRFNTSVTLAVTADGTTGSRFGNCAETYPFLYLLRDATLRDRTYGMALLLAKVAEKASYNASDYWNKKRIVQPCKNCKHLIANLGGNENNFKFNKDRV